jgi:uncharacterized membrane protein YgdD (TMEM256/DUF423 family)
VTRAWLAVAGLGGAASVIAGSLGAHLTGDPKAAELLRTGALYGLVHAAALVAVAALAQMIATRSAIGSATERETGRRTERGAAAVAGWCFAAGIVLFSGSLFALAAGAPRPFGWLTPVGGLALIIGWAALAALALRRC